MALLASEVMDNAASEYLNDPNKTLFTHVTMLPHMKAAVRELSTKFSMLGIQTNREVSSALAVAKNATAFTSIPGDIIVPLFLEERESGETLLSDYIPMREVDFIPSQEQTQRLRFWAFREDAIEFLGATTAREVRMRYMKSLAVVIDQNSSIPVDEAESYLSAVVAAKSARFHASTKDRAIDIAGQANVFLSDLLDTEILNMQGLPVRRRPYSARGRK